MKYINYQSIVNESENSDEHQRYLKKMVEKEDIYNMLDDYFLEGMPGEKC